MSRRRGTKKRSRLQDGGLGRLADDITGSTDPGREKREADGIGSVDGNTVCIEDEIVKMTENTLMFNSLVQMLNKKFSMLRYAINEGRK